MRQHVVEHPSAPCLVAQEVGLRLPARRGKGELETHRPKVTRIQPLKKGSHPQIGLPKTAAEAHLQASPRQPRGLYHPAGRGPVERHRLFHQHV